jgi:hypothetical protein
MDFTVKLLVTGKKTVDVSLKYGGETSESALEIVTPLKEAIKQLIHHDLHKDPKTPLKEVIGNIVLPETKGDWNIVLSLVGTDKDFSITYPKSDKATALRVEGALMTLMAELNKK